MSPRPPKVSAAFANIEFAGNTSFKVDRLPVSEMIGHRSTLVRAVRGRGTRLRRVGGRPIAGPASAGIESFFLRVGRHRSLSLVDQCSMAAIGSGEGIEVVTP